MYRILFILFILLLISCEFQIPTRTVYVDSTCYECIDSFRIEAILFWDSLRVDFIHKHNNSLAEISNKSINEINLESRKADKFVRDTLQGINTYFDSLGESKVFNNIFVDGKQLDSIELLNLTNHITKGQ